MKRRPSWLVIAGSAFIVVLFLFAVFGPSIGGGYLGRSTPYLPAGAQGHLLGTDEQGRDIVANLAYGARISLLIALAVQLIALTIGIFVGVLGVYAPKWIAVPTMRLTDAMFAFPDILLGILLIGIFNTVRVDPESYLADVLQTGIIPVIVALSITAWPGMARLVRSQLVSLKDREFVVASKASGASTFYTVTRHVLPQLWGLLLAVSMVELAGVILAEATLSFLGIGVKPPLLTWGKMIDNARAGMTSHPEQLIWPCFILSVTIFAMNFVGDGLRAYFDPKTK